MATLFTHRGTLTVPHYKKTWESSITISWEFDTDADYYILQRQMSSLFIKSDVWSEWVTVSNTSETEYEDTISITDDSVASLNYRVIAFYDTDSSPYEYAPPVSVINMEITSDNILLPYNMRIDMAKAQIDIIPSIRETKETIEGKDGELSISRKYNSRVFDMPLAQTFESISARNLIIRSICSDFNKAKKYLIRLLTNDKMFLVSGSSAAPTFEYNSSTLGVSLSYKASDVIGYGANNYIELKNTEQTITVGGDENPYPIFYIEILSTISISSISFALNDIEFTMSGTFNPSSNKYIVIDCFNKTAYSYVTSNPNVTNNITSLWGNVFPTLGIGNNTILQLTDTNDMRMFMRWNNNSIVL